MSMRIEDRPDWYANAKGSFKGSYTTEMKGNVIQSVQKKTGTMNIQSYFKAFIVTAVGICSLVACFIFINGNSDSMKSLLNAGGNLVQSNETSKPTTLLEEKSLSYSNEPIYIANSNIPLWDNSGYEFPIVNKLSVELENVVDLGEGNSYLNYFKPNEKDNIYQGIELKGYSKPDELFEWGYGSITDVKWGESKAFGGDFNKLSGRCGPYIICSLWLTVEENNVVLSHMLASEGYEADLDSDGTAEIIATTDKTFSNRIYIFKKREGIIEWAEVDTALQIGNEDLLSYDPSKENFVVSSEDGIRYYRYAQGEDKLVLVNE